MERHTPERGIKRRLETARAMGYLALQQAIDTLLTAVTSDKRTVYTDEWWQKKREHAAAFMQERQPQRQSVLLVATAQHPLKNGSQPGPEFAARLIACAERAKELHAQGKKITIYVPGSRHMHEDIADEIPLATAGTNMLHEYGLPEDIIIHGDNLNQQYKGAAGVYNSADEAYVSAHYFKDTPQLGALEVFCSPGQQARWELHAIACGILPEFKVIAPEGVPLFHNDPNNKQDKVAAYTRRLDPTWQSPKSLLGQGTRLLRQPK